MAKPPDPAALVTAVPNWTVGAILTTGRGEQFRILAIDTDIDEELVEQGFNAVLTRRARGRHSGLARVDRDPVA